MASLAREDFIQLPVQVDGKLRQVIQVDLEADQTEVERLALEQPKIQTHLAGRRVEKIIYVPGKALSIVTGKAS
jgi:leucyl-tRNA synthetase